jgi:hypothetical protein
MPFPASSLLWLTLVLSTPVSGAPSATADSSLEVAHKSIVAPDLTHHGAFLSSDAFEGRRAGSRGEGHAALYIASCLRRLGLVPGGADGTYFQHVPLKGDRLGFNVLGRIDGTDPGLRHEVVVLGAHYDHLGIDRNGEICNGADDNASGTSALLELAEAFTIFPPRRSVVVILFCGEEQGLLGSRFYCEHPLVPLRDTVTMINLDMVGRSEDDYLFVGGAGTSPVFRPLLTGWNRRFGFEMELKDPGGAPSDNMSFFNKVIPVLFFFTSSSPTCTRTITGSPTTGSASTSRGWRGSRAWSSRWPRRWPAPTSARDS